MELRVLWLLVFFIAPGVFGWMKERPVLESVDGHLVIWGAENKNVTIKTKGGYLNVNDIDIVNVANVAHKAASYVSSWRQNSWRDLQERVDRLLITVEGPDGLKKRFESLSGGSVNTSINFNDDGPVRTELSARVTDLEVKVRKIRRKLRKNECNSNPCKNGGTCIRIYGGYQCICPSNWQGESCQTDVNECAIYAGTDLGCQNGATCINTVGSYTCSCAKGWYGVHCMSRTSACNSEDSRELCGNGVCVDQKGSPLGYTCICDQGWKSEGGNPACLADVDECAGKQAVCSVNPRVECINLRGSYHCGNCPPGYTGNGHTCDDINECLEDNGGCSVSPRVKCYNIPGSRICAPCPPGYSGNGETCISVGLCSVNNGGCHPLATCMGTSSVVQCRCPPGYTGDGMGPGGCVASTQVTVDACSSSPCVHGICIPVAQNFVCHCNPGFSGPTCATPVNPCQPNPCKNNGSCMRTIDGGFSCECTAGFKGPRCGTPKNTCGGYIRDAAGNLEYPPATGTRDPGVMSCAFVFAVDPAKVLNVTFTRFKLPSTTACSTDFIQVHDGKSTADHLIGRFCGDKTPRNGTIITTHNHLYMWVNMRTTDPQNGFALHWESIEPSCGGFLEADYGTISSPGTPGKYPLNRNCTWEINVRAGRRIMFHFFTMQIEEHALCAKDYLQINETLGERAIQLGLYCNHTVPAPLYTSGNTAILYFHSDGDTQDQGFQIGYSTVATSPGCGGVFTTPEGTIRSPGTGDEYAPSQYCVWTIQLPPGERIRLTFQDMDIEGNQNCYYDSLKIYEGSNEDAPLIGTYCGEELPFPRTLNSNVATVTFTSDSSFQGRGFTLQYETHCGGEFHEPSGIITSPYYPNHYPEGRTCHYEIVQPPEKSIVLNVLDMDIEGHWHSGCFFDYLVVHDGDNENATEIGRLCGGSEKIPSDSFYSTHNYMYLQFHTDGSYSYRGFKANYTTIDRRCGGLFKESPGVIRSPGGDSGYSNEENCTWTIQAPVGHVIELTWVSFELETHFRCQNDYVEVTEEYDGEDISIMKVCGRDMPSNVISMGRIMNIYFHSDESVSYNGFVANYKFVDTSKSCGGRYLASVGVFTSPGYPSRYPNDQECEWVIEAPNRMQIRLNPISFDLEPSGNCDYDYLEIRNGAHANSPLIGTFCGDEIPGSIVSFTNHLYIKFYSDSSRPADGFRIEWDSTQRGCGGSLTGSSGDIMSPNYPSGYSPFSFCTWNIAVNQGNKIQIILVDVDFQADGDCRGDYLQISEGTNSIMKNSQKYCSATNHAPIDISSNTATVQFMSGFGHGGNGFHIKYHSICSGKLKGYSGVIESPNFPNDYPSNTNCSWIIEAPIGNKINISFSHFDLEPGREWRANPCGYDYLKIREGENDEPVTELGTFCPLEGMQMPPRITSTTNQLFINFVTDNSLHYGGFRLEWIVHGCGGHIKQASGEITSPDYPKPYPTEIDCEWVIEVEYGHSVQINFTDVQTEKTGGCDYDKIEVFGGASDEAPKLAELCHTDKPRLYVSPINKMMIRLHSDWSHSGRGFSAKFSTVQTMCGGVFKAPQGAIHSQNYPMNYPVNQNCEWLIQVDNHHVVNLTFTDVDIEGSRNCSVDYVKVFDGPTREHKVLAHFCAHDKPPPILSSGDTLLVVMQSDMADVGKGFRAEFERACGARIVTNGTGTLVTASDLHLKNSWDGHNCSWIIVAENPGDHITLTIPHMDLACAYGSCDEECSEHALQIYEGEGVDGPKRGQWCGLKTPPVIVSTGNALTLHLATYSYSDVSFSATYSALNSACGGDYYAESATLSSPGYPESYPANVECEWTLHTAPGNQILLEFSAFDLQLSSNCDRDYLEIREQSPTGKRLGTFCGNNATEIRSTETIWMKFKSDEGVAGTGFMMEYSFQHGSDVSGPSGVIASPMYPRPFTKVEEVHWRITVEVGFSVKIEFDDFHMDGFSEGECDYWSDGLMFYDGYDNEAPVLHGFCGFTKPEPFQSSSNIVYISFSGDRKRLGNWFKLRYYQVPRVTDQDKNKVTELSPCNEEIALMGADNNTVVIQSPGYPTGYNHSLNCNWVFNSPPGTHIAVEFLDINLEESENCEADSVAVYSGRQLARDPAPSSSLIGKYCLTNESRTTVESITNTMTLKFTTDNFANRTGFKAEVKRECGGQLSGSGGIIEFNDTEPGLPWKWARQCDWNVTVGRGKTIEVTILEIDLPDKNDRVCETHYIFLRNGHERDAPFLGDGKYCRQELPDPLMTTGNKLNVKISAYGNRGRYKLSYREVGMDCGGTYELTNGLTTQEISTPRYKNPPPPYSECTWKFLAPAGQRLSLHFVDRFDLTDSEDCQKEYVSVRDGGTDVSRTIGSYCGSKAPSTIVSTGNMLYVHYYTESDTPADGFKAMVTNEEVCGAILREKTGVITSPNYPGTYPKGKECFWWIIGAPYHSLRLQFTDFSFPGWRDCNDTDHLKIMEKLPNNETTGEPQIFCGRDEPTVIQTSTNEVLIALHTNGKTLGNYRGFRMNFTSTHDTCGGELNGESGLLYSSGYPSPRIYSMYCKWTITVPHGNQVKITINDMDVNLEGPISYNARFYNDFRFRSKIPYTLEANYERVVMSSSNKMMVIFNAERGRRGLSAKFEAVPPAPCGDAIETVNGTLTIPSLPGYSSRSFHCEWALTPPESMRQTITDEAGVTLAISVSGPIGNRTASTKHCLRRRSQIQVMDSKNLIGSACGNITDEPIVIRSLAPLNYVTITNGTRISPFRMNPRVTFSWSHCGGTLNGPEHVIRTPQNLAFPVNCVWKAEFGPGQSILMNFSKLNFKGCDKGYVLVRNGGPQSPQVGKYCGNIIPRNITSNSNKLWIEYFARDEPGEFEFSLNTMSTGCGNSHGFISSPGFPRQYPNNSECEWQFDVEPGYHIGLSFVDRFNLETSDNCAKDFVEVFDKNDTAWVSLGRVCGRDTPKPFNTTSNHIKVIFRANEAVRGDGFRAKIDKSCGGIFEATKIPQTIMSPNYPYGYSNRLVCNYTIVPPRGRAAIIEFEDFELDTVPPSCRWANLTMDRQQHYWRQGTDVWCGKSKPAIVTTPTPISLIFKTSYAIEGKGFVFKFMTNECGGEISQPGILSSPTTSDGSSYYRGINCTWVITAPSNKAITLRFEEFDLEFSYRCNYDYVRTYEGRFVNRSKLMSTHCGNQTSNPPMVKSIGNMMTVNFYSDGSNSRKGFRAQVLFGRSEASGCGGRLNLTGTMNWNSHRTTPYDNFEDCVWQLQAETGKVIRINFQSFDVKNTGNRTIAPETAPCNGDYLELRDGRGPLSELIGRYCGSTLPDNIITSRNYLWMRFYSDGEYTGNGVRAEISVEPSICGNSFIEVSNTTVTLNSPRFPDNYPLGASCKWTLRSVRGQDLHIHLKNIDMEDSKDCTGDNLRITDKRVNRHIDEGFGENLVITGRNHQMGRRPIGMIHSAVTALTFCGKVESYDYYTGGSTVEVALKSTQSNPSKSRKFEVDVSISDCKKNYTQPQGRIYHQGFTDCRTTITVPIGHTISLYFLTFRLYDTKLCPNKYLKVYDGNFDAELIGTYCGGRVPAPIFSTGNQLSLMSTARQGSNWEIYDLVYTSTDQGRGCGGSLFNYAGKFTSPMFPNTYRNDSTCVWDVSVPRGSKVLLQFTTFDIGLTETCDAYLEVREKAEVDYVRTKYCGGERPADYKSHSNEVQVVYVSTVNNGGTGWEIKFNAVDEEFEDTDDGPFYMRRFPHLPRFG